MDSAFDAHAIDIALEPLPVDQCPDGPVSTGLAVLARTDAYEVGVWEHTAGRSTDIETDEVFVVISGSGRVLLENGDVLDRIGLCAMHSRWRSSSSEGDSTQRNSRLMTRL